MSEIAQRLTERRVNVWEQMKALADRAIEEKRDLSAEEQGQLDAMNAELDNLDKRVKSFVEADQRAKEIEDHFINSGSKGSKGEDRGGQRSEFSQWAREARFGDVREVENRAMSASGGVGPDSVYTRLWEYAVATSQLLESAYVMNTTDGNTLPIPVATQHASLSTTPVAANAALPTSDSVLTTVNLSVSKYPYLTLVPSELIQDVNFDLEGYIARNAGRQAGIQLGNVAATAATTGYVTAGVTPVAGAGITTSLGDQSKPNQGTDLIIQLYHSVLPEYRSQASTAWLLNDASAAIVRQIKGTTGDSVWQPSLTAGDPDLILGKPVRIVPQLDSFGATKKPIYFGDVGSLYVRIAGGIRFERSNEYAFGNDQAAFRCIVRAGAVVVDPNAVKYLATPAT